MAQAKVETPKFKLFDRYDVSEIEIKDEGMKNVINLNPQLVTKTYGRREGKFGQADVNVVERLVNKVATAGHRGKKHKIEKGESTGQDTKNFKIVLEALEIIKNKSGENPIQVLVRAIENSAPRDEVTVVEYGGAKYPQAVDVSPLRRINLALKHLAHGSSDKAFKQKKTFAQGLAEEISLAAEDNGTSFGVKKKTEAEKQADSAR